MSTKIYITTVGENEITVSLNGEAAVTKTVKPTITAIGNSKIRFICDDIDETVETHLHIFINGAALKATWIGDEEYLSVALFDAVMNKTFTASSSPGGSSYLSLDPASPETVTLVWAGSQAEYDGLTPVATTIYFIIP